MALQQQFATIDRAMLTPLVRQALCKPAVEGGAWTMTPVVGGSNERVYRVAGTGIDRGTVITWSLMLKTAPLHEEGKESGIFEAPRGRLLPLGLAGAVTGWAGCAPLL